eukprot:scaffold59250_cov28-Tisochrysis_lutea.AAC.2
MEKDQSGFDYWQRGHTAEWLEHIRVVHYRYLNSYVQYPAVVGEWLVYDCVVHVLFILGLRLESPDLAIFGGSVTGNFSETPWTRLPQNCGKKGQCGEKWASFHPAPFHQCYPQMGS